MVGEPARPAVAEWIKSTGAKICIVFEGRDTAGKGLPVTSYGDS